MNTMISTAGRFALRASQGNTSSRPARPTQKTPFRKMVFGKRDISDSLPGQCRIW
jgi:hypothetical protein